MLLHCLVLSKQPSLSSYMEAQVPFPEFLSQFFPIVLCEVLFPSPATFQPALVKVIQVVVDIKCGGHVQSPHIRHSQKTAFKGIASLYKA